MVIPLALVAENTLMIELLVGGNLECIAKNKKASDCVDSNAVNGVS